MALNWAKQTDRSIVRRVLAGRRDDFSLLERYLPVVQATAMARLRNAADAEDAAQETFLKAFQSLDSLRDKAKFGPWLLAIARNTCSRITEKRGRVERLIETGAPSWGSGLES